MQNIWYLLQDQPGGWGQQVDPSQWSAYYAYGQGYDAYAYGSTQDPSVYAYGAYAGYMHYPQQVRCPRQHLASAFHLRYCVILFWQRYMGYQGSLFYGYR